MTPVICYYLMSNHQSPLTFSSKSLLASSSLAWSSVKLLVSWSSWVCKELLSDWSWAFLLLSFSVKPSSSASRSLLPCTSCWKSAIWLVRQFTSSRRDATSCLSLRGKYYSVTACSELARFVWSKWQEEGKESKKLCINESGFGPPTNLKSSTHRKKHFNQWKVSLSNNHMTGRATEGHRVPPCPMCYICVRPIFKFNQGQALYCNPYHKHITFKRKQTDKTENVLSAYIHYIKHHH